MHDEALECDKLVITTSQVGSRKFPIACEICSRNRTWLWNSDPSQDKTW